MEETMRATRFIGSALLAAIAVPAFVSAQVVISEIMYDQAEGSDSGREWIEVYNAGAVSVPLADWKVFENGTNHKITAVVGGEALATGAYAVIADNAEKFKADHPAFSGQLFDSAFSLSNGGETIALHDKALGESDSVAYADTMGGSGTGDSLQRVQLISGTAFSAGTPTPGVPIPASGLVKSPVKEKKSSLKTKTPKATSVISAPDIVGDTSPKAEPTAENQTASAAGSSAPYVWWLGACAIAGIAAIGIALARRARKTEWDIIEEMPQSM